MKFKYFFKLFILAFMPVMFSVPSFAEGETINSLSQIVVDKPIDNDYMLSLYFKEHFQGNAFLQKRKNGSFFVYIPDTVMTSKNVKMIYKGNVRQSDVKISIEEQPFIKEEGQSRYIRLAVDTPVNSDIQLTAQVLDKSKSIIGGSFMGIYSIIIFVLLAVVSILSFSIFNAVKSINRRSNSYTTFPAEFLNSPNEYVRKTTDKLTYEKPAKIDVDAKIISPISTNVFSCFNLPLKKEELSAPISSAVDNVTTPSIEDRTIQSSVTNPIKKQNSVIEDESELDLPSTDDITPEKNDEIVQTDDETYRPELISELKIAANKGFYLTTVGDNSFALFGYIGEKIFFLQKFNDLTQVNLQTRFYDRKGEKDLYIVKLDSYKAMLSVSEDEIKELAVI